MLKPNMQIFTVILIFIETSVGKLFQCSEIMHTICAKSPNYTALNNPKPFPTMVNITLKFYEILNVDESKQTMTLSMQALLEWKDHRLHINRSQEYIEKYHFSTSFYMQFPTK